MIDTLMHELEALSNEALEDIAGTHVMLNEQCPPKIRMQIRNKQTAAQEILESRQVAAQVPPR